MRTRSLLAAGLLGLLLLAANAAEEHLSAEDGGEEAEKAEKTSEIEEEMDVMVLHANNFARALSENAILLVEFYAPWCGHCRQLEPVYAEVAGKLKAEEAEPAMRLAKVDATEEAELSEEFGVGSFPTLKLFVDGDRSRPIDYTGQRSAEGIIQWLKRRAGPGALELGTADAAAEFIHAHKTAVVGFFSNPESEAAEVFHQVFADMTDQEFGVTAAPEVFQKYGVKGDAVVLFKKFDDGRADLIVAEDGKLDKSDLVFFIKRNRMELIIPFTQETSGDIFSISIKHHSLLFYSSSEESQKVLVDACRPVAKEFSKDMLFVSINVTEEMSQVLSYFGVSPSELPTARLLNTETGLKFKMESEGFTPASLQQLCREVVDGTAKPYYKSQEVPQDWDQGPVKVLVGKNFGSVALDPSKNVLVEFYAPWCGHCKELAPVWEKLGEKYAGHDDIIIAKMDATANEVESVSVKGFPTIKYFPAGGKEAVEYTGTRDLETFSKFLDNGGVLPEDEDEDGGDEAEEAEESTEKATNGTSKDEL